MAQRGGQPISSRGEGLARLTRLASEPGDCDKHCHGDYNNNHSSERTKSGAMPATFAASDWLRRAAEIWAEADAADDLTTKRLKIMLAQGASASRIMLRRQWRRS